METYWQEKRALSDYGKKRFVFFAGLCETWTDPSGQRIPTFTIITTGPNELIRNIHDRMPAILHPNDESLWLDMTQPTDKILELLRPYPVSEMEAYQVSANVNNPRYDHPDIIQQVGVSTEN